MTASSHLDKADQSNQALQKKKKGRVMGKREFYKLKMHISATAQAQFDKHMPLILP